jgi:hypothetical protein
MHTKSGTCQEKENERKSRRKGRKGRREERRRSARDVIIGDLLRFASERETYIDEQKRRL